MLILILINVQYFQNVVFSFENGLNGQNLSSSDSYHLIFPPAGGDFPYLLLLFGQRWRVVPSKHLKYGTKKVPIAASLIYWFSMFLLTVLHMKPRNFVKSQVQMFHFLNLKIWSKSACHMYGNTEASIYIISIYIYFPIFFWGQKFHLISTAINPKTISVLQNATNTFQTGWKSIFPA